MTSPTVSVVMINRNDSAWLPAAVESVLATENVSFELIVVDDASNDSSPHLIVDYGRKDSRIHPLLLQTNVGISAARNRGIDKARGEFIALIDSDDLFLPHTLESMITAFDEARGMREDVCFLATDAWLISEQGRRFGRYITPNYWDRMVLDDPPKWTLPSTWFFRKDTPVRFFEPYMVGEAPIFVERMAAHGAIAFCGKPLVEYRMRSKSVSNASGQRTLRGFNAANESIRQGRLDNPLLPEEVPLPGWRQTAAWIHGRNAKAYAANGRWIMAARETLIALVANPERCLSKIANYIKQRGTSRKSRPGY
jgi:glycosyltransferase involved in cell wall biosynthesis